MVSKRNNRPRGIKRRVGHGVGSADTPCLWEKEKEKTTDSVKENVAHKEQVSQGAKMRLGGYVTCLEVVLWGFHHRHCYHRDIDRNGNIANISVNSIIIASEHKDNNSNPIERATKG